MTSFSGKKRIFSRLNVKSISTGVRCLENYEMSSRHMLQLPFQRGFHSAGLKAFSGVSDKEQSIADESDSVKNEPIEEYEEEKDDSNNNNNIEQIGTSDLLRIDSDEYANDEEYEPPRTNADKFNFFMVSGMQLLIMGILSLGAIYTVKELFPGRMKPQTLYNEAYDILKNNDDIKRICGEPLRAFGRDTGNESRRTQIDSREYNEADGSKRVRVRFNIKGPNGHVKVWAEASDRMPSSEWVYLITQNMRTGHVLTVYDNRARLEMEMLTNSNDGSSTGSTIMDSLNTLLKGNSGGGSGLGGGSDGGGK